MTLGAEVVNPHRPPERRRIRLTANQGIELKIGQDHTGNPAHMSVTVTEDVNHVRSFWSYLGRVLDEADEPLPEPAEAEPVDLLAEDDSAPGW